MTRKTDGQTDRMSVSFAFERRGWTQLGKGREGGRETTRVFALPAWSLPSRSTHEQLSPCSRRYGAHLGRAHQLGTAREENPRWCDNRSPSLVTEGVRQSISETVWLCKSTGARCGKRGLKKGPMSSPSRAHTNHLAFSSRALSSRGKTCPAHPVPQGAPTRPPPGLRGARAGLGLGQTRWRPRTVSRAARRHDAMWLLNVTNLANVRSTPY